MNTIIKRVGFTPDVLAWLSSHLVYPQLSMDNCGSIHAAFDGDAVVGGITTFKSRQQGLLCENLFVVESHRRQGIALALWEAAGKPAPLGIAYNDAARGFWARAVPAPAEQASTPVQVSAPIPAPPPVLRTPAPVLTPASVFQPPTEPLPIDPQYTIAADGAVLLPVANASMMEAARRHLAARQKRWVRLDPGMERRPSVMIDAGRVFHDRAGFELEMTAYDGHGTPWDLDRQPVLEDPKLRLVEPRCKLASSGEIHICISLTDEIVRNGIYGTWASSQPAPQRLWEILPPGSPQRGAVDRRNVTDFAASVAAHLVRMRPKAGQLVRLFIAAPIPFSVVLGRQIRALEDVIVMDWDRQSETFKEGSRFRC